MIGKKYFSIHGPDVNGTWKLMAYQWVEDKYYPGNFGVSTLWLRPKFYSSLDELVAEIEAETVSKC